MTVRITGLALAFLSHIVLSRTLGANEYGSYVIAVGWAMVLVVPARLGLDNSVLRFATIYREEARAADLRGLVIYSLACIVICSLSLVLVLLLAKAVGIWPFQTIGWMLLIGFGLLVLFTAVLGWFSSLIRTANRIFASQFYEQVLRPALLMVGLVLLGLVGRRLDASSAMLITAAAVGVALIGIGHQSWAAFAAMLSKRASFEHRHEWLSVSWVLLLMALVQELLNQIDLILLGILSSATQAAQFAAAWRLASLVPFGLIAIVTVSGPLIASAHNRGDVSELARIARLNARLSTLFAVTVSLLLVIFGKLALALFGPGFEAAYPTMLIMLVGGLVNSFTGTVGYLLIMTGRQQVALRILSGGLLISIVANILLIPHYGATGSAIASALALSGWNVAMAFYVRRKMGVDATAWGRPPKAAPSG